MKRHRSGDLFERILGGPVLWTGLAIMTLFAMGPFLWALSASLKTRVELYATPITYIPAHPTLRNYVEAWTSRLTPFSVFFANSLWVSSVTMVATIVISTSAGYALARFRFIGKNTLMLVFLATQMFPAVLLIPPLLSQWYALGLIDTYQALIYSNFSFTVPVHGLDAGRLLREHPARAGGERHDRRLQPVRRHAQDHRAPGGAGDRRHRHLRLRLLLERAALRHHVHQQHRDADALGRASSTWPASTRSSGASCPPA